MSSESENAYDKNGVDPSCDTAQPDAESKTAESAEHESEDWSSNAANEAKNATADCEIKSEQTHNDEEASNPTQELAQQFEETKKQMLMVMAEAENVRKRSQIEIENARKFALESFVKELLSVVDSLELAAGVDVDVNDQKALSDMKQGIELTLKQLSNVFGKYFIEQVAPKLGNSLDPQLHQSIGVVPDADVPANCIARIIQKGYTLNQRLLRPAMVLTAQKSDSLETQTEDSN